jgi:hypothetical protein
MPICKNCNKKFPNRMLIDGKVRFLHTRKFCLECSPRGSRNTRSDLNAVPEGKIVTVKRANDKLSKKRKLVKLELVNQCGGSCIQCGYNKCIQALSFHHRDRASKQFNISRIYARSREIIANEIAKCDLLCLNCHMEIEYQHVENICRLQQWATNRRQKLIKMSGGSCQICGYNKCQAVLVFHHRNPDEKEFTITTQHLVYAWERIMNEWKKCDLLCCNCHTEVHYNGT